jgi:hypothetical protein
LNKGIFTFLQDRDLILFVFQNAAHQVKQFMLIINNKYLFSHKSSALQARALIQARREAPPPVITTSNNYDFTISLPNSWMRLTK